MTNYIYHICLINSYQSPDTLFKCVRNGQCTMRCSVPTFVVKSCITGLNVRVRLYKYLSSLFTVRLSVSLILVFGAHEYPPNSNFPNVYCTEIHLTELPFALIYTFPKYYFPYFLFIRIIIYLIFVLFFFLITICPNFYYSESPFGIIFIFQNRHLSVCLFFRIARYFKNKNCYGNLKELLEETNWKSIEV